MPILKIARMGHPILRKKARKLTTKEITSPGIAKLVQDMIETLHDASGLGLAAPQVHESIQLAIIEFDADNPRYQNAKINGQPLIVVINPVTKILDKTLQGNWEGCLSVPGLRGFVRRPRKVQIDYVDLQAKKQKIIATDFLATVFQHELDHLQGKLYLDQMIEKDRERLAFMDEFQRYWL
jgi:peptide deformylase